MIGYDRWHWDQEEDSQLKRESELKERLAILRQMMERNNSQQPPDPKREALENIAYDCASLNDAQQLAREALRRQA